MKFKILRDILKILYIILILYIINGLEKIIKNRQTAFGNNQYNLCYNKRMQQAQNGGNQKL